MKTSNNLVWRESARRCQRPVDAVRQRPEWSEETCSSPAGLEKKRYIMRCISFPQSARRDSNPRPRPWQGRAPPTEPLAHRLLCRSCLPDTFDIIQQELQFVNTKFEIFMQIEAVRRNQYPERSKETWSKTRRVNPHERMGQWNQSVIKKYV